MKIYLDFDGVILDTDSVIYQEYVKIPGMDRRKFAQSYDWFKLMDDKLIIHNSLNMIKKSKYEIILLSKISSINEGQAKIKYLRSKEIDIDINLVPVGFDKCDAVCALGNILIDDKVVNLDAWSKKGGISIYFNKDDNDIDIHGDRNSLYPKISDLSCLIDGIDNIIQKKA